MQSYLCDLAAAEIKAGVRALIRTPFNRNSMSTERKKCFKEYVSNSARWDFANRSKSTPGSWLRFASFKTHSQYLHISSSRQLPHRQVCLFRGCMPICKIQSVRIFALFMTPRGLSAEKDASSIISESYTKIARTSGRAEAHEQTAGPCTFWFSARVCAAAYRIAAYALPGQGRVEKYRNSLRHESSHCNTSPNFTSVASKSSTSDNPLFQL